MGNEEQMPPRLLMPAIFAITCFVIGEAATAASFDGTYIGKRVLTKGDPSACIAQDTASVTIHDG
jgi:hypothetical protein